MKPTLMRSTVVDCVSWLVDRDLVLHSSVRHYDNPSYQYMVSGQAIPAADFVRDLGVLFDKEFIILYVHSS